MATATAIANKSKSAKTAKIILANGERQSVQIAINKIVAIMANKTAATIINAIQ